MIVPLLEFTSIVAVPSPIVMVSPVYAGFLNNCSIAFSAPL